MSCFKLSALKIVRHNWGLRLIGSEFENSFISENCTQISALSSVSFYMNQDLIDFCLFERGSSIDKVALNTFLF